MLSPSVARIPNDSAKEVTSRLGADDFLDGLRKGQVTMLDGTPKETMYEDKVGCGETSKNAAVG